MRNNNSDPLWQPIEVDIRQLCGADEKLPLKLQVRAAAVWGTAQPRPPVRTHPPATRVHMHVFAAPSPSMGPPPRLPAPTMTPSRRLPTPATSVCAPTSPGLGF